MPKAITNLPTEGTVLGQSASDKIGFYGLTTAIVQPSGAIAVTTTEAAITQFGFASAQAANLVSAVNFLTSAMSNLGLIR